VANLDLIRDVAIPDERRRRYVRAGYWDDVTLINRLDHWAAKTPDRAAVVDLVGTRRKSFREVQSDSCKVAALFSSLGVGAGDVVAVQLPNWYETVVIGLGVLRLGAVLNPLIPNYGAKELRLMLEISKARVIVTPIEYRSSKYIERIGEATQGLADRVHHITIRDPNVVADPIAELLCGVQPMSPGVSANAADVSMLLFTSGTESTPKAILHTEQTTCCGVKEMGKFLGLGPEDVVWMPMPIGHSTGFNFGLRLALYHGLKFVLQDRWDSEVAVQLCTSEGITCTGVSPTHLLDMLATLRTKPANLSSLRYFGCAGAPIPAGVVEAAAEFGITVLRGYGSTESLTIAKIKPDFPQLARSKTDGQVMPAVEVELRSDDGRVVAHNQEGEIFARSPLSCVGFAPVPCGQPNGNLPADGWIRSGDVAIIDDDKFLSIVGRKKEIIIRGGMNVAPREIEESLLKHRSIAKASVVGLPDQRLGETVCACIVLQAGVILDFKGIIEHLIALDIATYKLPSRIEFLDALPTTETGKVKKPELVAWVLGKPDTLRSTGGASEASPA
jgi:acyl-CoA synthetase (AMP-forming)/AMP-acid ligase II